MATGKWSPAEVSRLMRTRLPGHARTLEKRPPPQSWQAQCRCGWSGERRGTAKKAKTDYTVHKLAVFDMMGLLH